MLPVYYVAVLLRLFLARWLLFRRAEMVADIKKMRIAAVFVAVCRDRDAHNILTP
jgi:hypothetical protein